MDSSLRTRPLIVAQGGGARSLVYDMSEEAFAEGVRKRMPLRRAERLCKGSRIIAPKPHRYEKAMQALFKRVEPFSPLIESEEDSGHIFLDLTGTKKLFGPPQDVAWRIQKTMRGELGLEPIWALARNKLVAKAASRVVKPLGEIVIPSGGEEGFVGSLPLHLVPGIEPEDLRLWREYNIWRADQALMWSPGHLGVVFGKRAGFFYRVLRGQDDAPVLPVGQRLDRISLDHEFSEDTNDIKQVEAALYGLAERAGARLRGAGRVARRVALLLDYSDGGRVVRQRSHPMGTANDFLLYELAQKALVSAWIRRVRLRHLRLICARLIFPPRQLELFSDEQMQPKGERLISALDRIRQRHGDDKIRMGKVFGA
jgi:DNA polymerase-4